MMWLFESVTFNNTTKNEASLLNQNLEIKQDMESLSLKIIPLTIISMAFFCIPFLFSAIESAEDATNEFIFYLLFFVTPIAIFVVIWLIRFYLCNKALKKLQTQYNDLVQFLHNIEIGNTQPELQETYNNIILSEKQEEILEQELKELREKTTINMQTILDTHKLPN